MLDHKEAEVLLLQQDKLEAAGGIEVEQEDRMLEVDVEGLELKNQDSLLEVVELSLKSVGHREMLLSYFGKRINHVDKAQNATNSTDFFVRPPPSGFSSAATAFWITCLIHEYILILYRFARFASLGMFEGGLPANVYFHFISMQV